ncbi:uncharacterized protein LOC143277313 [Babylonia areolata]|uniref:uncharacterized protein LOC143277313 n=1 Tax=Babylonia areolata TaxID=304850 RepID=UPI003FD051A4
MVNTGLQVCSSMLGKIIQSKTEGSKTEQRITNQTQGKARQNRTWQGKTGKTGHGKARQAKQGMARQLMAKEGKAKQDMARQDRQNRTWSGQRKTNSHNSTVSRGNAPAGRPVLVKFVSRRTKVTLIEKRRALKETQEFKKVFINDDLTPLCSRLLHVAKRNEAVDRVSTTHDGRIRCVLKKTPGQTTKAKVVLIDNPDDLFHLGVDSVDFEALGLQHVVG